jgi:hypothetical protein
MPRRKDDNWKVYEPLIRSFEDNDLGERLTAIEPVDAKVHITKRAFMVNIENDIAQRLSQIARKGKISSTMLLHRWLKEKIAESTLTANNKR